MKIVELDFCSSKAFSLILRLRRKKILFLLKFSGLEWVQKLKLA